jgi:pyrroloquinoline-quinone synthase
LGGRPGRHGDRDLSDIPAIDALADADALETALRAIGAARYHIHHPFHRLLHGGRLDRGQVQAWALNRYLYQARIPLKDAALIARCTDRALRREWLSRITDHDGSGDQEGGIVRWLRLCEGLGLDPAYVESEAGALPATRFAVEAYLRFVRERSLLEAVASSLTELFAPQIHEQRIPGMLAGYPFVTDAMMAYFRRRLDQAPRDAGFALAYVRRHAATPELRRLVCEALLFKCSVLWAQLDALHHAYVLMGGIPPGAFVPDGPRARAA